MDELTIREIQRLLSENKLSATELVHEYQQSIESVDKSGPSINAIIEMNPDAPDQAKTLDRERRAGVVRSALHGIPLILKDNIDTADSMLTTAGSLALANSKASEDAFIVRNLRKAGAIILGKANLSEWANFRSAHSTSGWSSRGGLTRNPYALDRSACGSSSGSAVAVAANLCAVSVGTETDGSIICPSHTNGIVGLKPTLGLVSRTGIIPIAHSQDTAGPMGRTVGDVALLLTTIAGFDPEDQGTKRMKSTPAIDYAAYRPTGGLINKRIGVARQFWGEDFNVDKIMDESIKVFAQLGATIVDPVEIPNKNKYEESEFEVLLFEFKADLNKYLMRLGPESPVRSLEDIIRFNSENAKTVMPFFGQDRMLAAQKKGDLTEKDYRKALARNRKFANREGLAKSFALNKLDAILAPSGYPAWVIDLINGDHYRGGSSSPAAVSGYPSITIPAGYVHGLPVGLSLIGLPFSEYCLIEMSSAFEVETQIRVKPKFRSSIPDA